MHGKIFPFKFVVFRKTMEACTIHAFYIISSLKTNKSNTLNENSNWRYILF